MIKAPPGAGKSTLVRKLAAAVGLRPLLFNITQMLLRTDLLEAFDTIATTQAQSRSEKLLVFFDEINAFLEGHHVYDAFLAPLEDGIYVRQGKTYTLEPCIWMFAGTRAPTDDEDSTHSNKASDFESRLSMRPPLDMTITHANSAEHLLEQVYLGISLLRQNFPDVGKVSEKVLKLFSMQSPLSPRDFKHFIQTFRDVQYGEVSLKNVAKEQSAGLFEDVPIKWIDIQ